MVWLGAPPPGPVGIVGRIALGLVFVGLALLWRNPDWQDAVVGLIAMPALVLVGVLLWARHSSRPLRAVGPFGHAVNLAVLVPLFALPATAGAAFLFYGVSMLVAGARRTGGCEVTAISNAVLRRDDQVGCPVFGPIDAAEAALRRSSPGDRVDAQP